VAAVRRLRDTKKTLAGQQDAALERSLSLLDDAFTKLTGQKPTRHPGESYAGRTLTHLDSRRNLRLRMPSDVLSRVARPLSLILLSARWYTHRLAALVTEEIDRIFDALGGSQDASVPLAQLWQASAGLFGSHPGSPIATAAVELEGAWRAVLAPWAGASGAEVHVPSAAIAREAIRAFDAPGPGWPSARHHSPDLLIEARDFAAICAGDYRVILGELHAGVNTLCTLSATSLCPFLPRLVGAFETDLGPHTLSPIPSEPFARSTLDSYLSRDAWHLDLGMGCDSRLPGARVVRVERLRVCRRGSTLVVPCAETGRTYPLMEILDRSLRNAGAHFSLVRAFRESPRISIDDLVVQRQTWLLGLERSAFAFEKTRSARFAGLRRLARQLGLPRWVLAKAEGEPKPVLIDTRSPLLGDMLAKLLRRGQPVSATEMLPDLEHLWLEDADRRRYVAELRLVAVDPVFFTSP